MVNLIEAQQKLKLSKSNQDLLNIFQTLMILNRGPKDTFPTTATRLIAFYLQYKTPLDEINAFERLLEKDTSKITTEIKALYEKRKINEGMKNDRQVLYRHVLTTAGNLLEKAATEGNAKQVREIMDNVPNVNNSAALSEAIGNTDIIKVLLETGGMNRGTAKLFRYSNIYHRANNQELKDELDKYAAPYKKEIIDKTEVFLKSITGKGFAHVNREASMDKQLKTATNEAVIKIQKLSKADIAFNQYKKEVFEDAMSIPLMAFSVYYGCRMLLKHLCEKHDGRYAFGWNLRNQSYVDLSPLPPKSAYINVLTVASSQGHPACLEILLDYLKKRVEIGFDSPQEHEFTYKSIRVAFNISIVRGHTDIAKLWIEKNPNDIGLNEKDDNEKTPLDYAIEYKRDDIKKLIEEAIAIKNTVPKQDKPEDQGESSHAASRNKRK